MKEKYSISAFWSEDDNGFIALISEFPGLSAFGATRKQAIKEAEIALQGMIEAYIEDNEALPEPKVMPEHSGQFRVRIPQSLHTKLSFEAERQGVSLNAYTIMLLSQTDNKALENKINGLENKMDNLTRLIEQSNPTQNIFISYSSNQHPIVKYHTDYSIKPNTSPVRRVQ